MNTVDKGFFYREYINVDSDNLVEEKIYSRFVKAKNMGCIF